MGIMEGLICQSCGMPMQKDKDFGANADSSKNKEYCYFCFKDRKFTDEGITTGQNSEKNIEIAMKIGMPKDKARKIANNTLLKLKRERNN